MSSNVLYAQMPNCDNYYIMSGNRFYTMNTATNTGTLNSIILPPNSSGLAINDNLNGGTPSPTYYTVRSGIYWYYNGTTWISTGHTSGSSAAVNPGGAGPYIYNLDGANDKLYRYDGTGNSTLFLDLGNYNGPFDVIGDQYGNVYVMHNGSGNQGLVMYSPNGQILCTYTFTGLPSSTTGGGYAIANGKLYTNSGSANYVGTINGNTIDFTTFAFSGSASDFASCPFPVTNVTLTPSSSALDWCANATFTISGTTSVVNPIWSWTGPGIVSGGNTSTITLNQPGVYTVIVTSNGGSCSGSATNQYTVVSNSNPPAVTQPNPMCLNAAPIQLLAVPATGLWSSNCGNCVSASGMFDPAIAGVGSHTLTYSTSGACAGTESIIIVVNDLPTVSAGADQTICEGASASLSASGASTYLWSTGVSTANTSVSPASTTSYTVTGTNTNGCANTDDVLVTIRPIPFPLITGNLEYCAGSNATLMVSSGFTNYSWSSGSTSATSPATIANNPITVTVTDAIGCSGTSDPITVTEINNVVFNAAIQICQGNSVIIHGVTRTTSGVYSSSFTAANGCDSTANVTLSVNPLPVINAGPDQVICIGESATLLATGGISYMWNNGLGAGSSHSITPLVTGEITYTVTGADANGCQSTDNLILRIDALPIVNAGSNIEICSGEKVTLLATGAATYVWDNGIVNGVSFEPTTTQTYTVIGTTVFGCVNQDEVEIVVNPSPSVSFTGTNLTGCAPMTPSFQATVTGTINTYLWEFGDGHTSSDILQTTHTYINHACYDVKLTVTSDKGCSNFAELSNFVCTYENPTANFTFTNNDLMSESTMTGFINNSLNGATYLWSFGDNSPQSNLFAPTHTFPGPDGGYYEVKLLVISPDGCLDSVINTIEVIEDIIFYVPNAFTPDGDAFNNTFKPVFTFGIDPNSYTMYIYNRWGEIIFETNDVSVGWDGTYNGEIVQDGTYSYTIKFKVKGKDDYKKHQGHLTKLR